MLRIIAWSALLAIAVATLGPIGIRPHSLFPVQVERAGAFLVVGLVFALAYPRHFALVCILVLGAAMLFELLQLIAPSRHGRVFDLAVKLGGGAIGLGLGWVIGQVLRRRALLRHPS